MRRSIRVVLSAALALVLLALLVTAVGWRALLAELRQADASWVALAGGISLVSLVAWSEEVVRLFRTAGGTAGGVRARTGYFSGVFGKLVAPGGHVGGMGVVAYVLGEYTDEPFERSLVAVSAAEFLNNVASATLASVGLVYLVLASGAPGTFVRAAAVAVVVLVGGLVASYVLLVRLEGIERLLSWLASVGRRTVGRVSTRVRDALAEDAVEERIENLRNTLDTVRDDRATLALSVGIAHVGWICYAVPLYCSLRAVGAPVALPVALFVVPVAGLAAVVSTPGGLGTVDTALAGILVLLTPTGPAVAGAATFIFRAVTYGLTLLTTGVIALTAVATGRADPLAALRS